MDTEHSVQTALEILLKPDVQAVFDSFSACFGIRTLFYTPEGEILTTGRTRATDSRYCDLLQDRVFGEARCLECDAQKREQAARERRMVYYRCHAGLYEAVVPLFAQQQLLGFVMIGQFRTDSALPREARTLARGKLPTKQLAAAYAELPLVTPDRIADVLRLFAVLADYIVLQNMVRLKGNLLLDRILGLIRSRIDRPVSLNEAAALVHRSRSTVSHLFNEKLGRSFRQVCIQTKLDKAEEYMRTIPNITVAEAARMVGYSDPFHFSSLYKKHRGMPPSAYRRQAATEP